MKFYVVLLSLISFSAYSQTFTIPTNGKPLVVKACSGKVYDNGGSKGDVIQETDGTITIVPAEKGKIIRLEIDTLDKAFDDSMFVYQGKVKNDASLVGIPRGVFLKRNPVFYGSEKDGSITIQYKSVKSPWNRPGFSAKISCIDKKVAFDFTIEKIMISKTNTNAKDKIYVYLYIPGQKEKAPGFKVNIYYSKDKVLDKSDVLGEPIFIDGLSEIAVNMNADSKIPEKVTNGDYYIIAELDPGNAISELDEKNNIIVSEVYKIEK